MYQKETVGKVTRLTLKNLDNTHAMGAIFYGNQHAVQTGNCVCENVFWFRITFLKYIFASKNDEQETRFDAWDY